MTERESLTPGDPIVSWAIDVPESIRVFERFGVDYCCGGKSLARACKQRDVDPQLVVAEIERAVAKEASE